MTIETGNCLFCFRPFVKPDKRNPSGQTCGLIHKDPGVDDASKAGEHVLHILLCHGPREPTDIQVGIFDDLGARASIGHLDGLDCSSDHSAC